MRKLITVFIMTLMITAAAMARPITKVVYEEEIQPEEITSFDNGITIVTTAFFKSSEDAYNYIKSLHLRTIGSPKKIKSVIHLTSMSSRHTYKASYEELTHLDNDKHAGYKRLYIYCGDHIKEYKVTEDEDYILQKAKLEGRF